MAPQTAVANTVAESHFARRKRRLSESLTVFGVFVPPVIAFASLLVWTAAVIYYIETTYRNDMGFWALILMGIAVIAAVPVAALTFALSLLTTPWRRAVSLLAAATCLALVIVAFPIIALLHSSRTSVFETYAIFSGLLAIPPCLVGIASSEFIHQLAEETESPPRR